LSALDEGDEDVVRQFKDMMPFYGVELQSHAAVVLGLMLLLFAGIQAWGQLATASRLMWYHSVAFSAFVGVVLASSVYQMLRLYVFGKFASALMYASRVSWKKGKAEFLERHPDVKWEEGLPFFKISAISGSHFEDNARLILALKLMNSKYHVSFYRVLVPAFELGIILSYVLVFGTFDSNSLLGLSSVALVGIFGRYLCQVTFHWTQKHRKSRDRIGRLIDKAINWFPA
jgi:hypothetical protein